MNATTRMNVAAAVSVTMAMMVSGFVAPVACADPADPSATAPAACAYTLTKPSKVTVNGADMVTATLSHGPCTGEITPNAMTVCVAIKDAGTPQCAFHPTFDPIQVYFQPYRSGATYVSTGRGCGNVFPTADQSCSSLGPYVTTL